MILNYGFSLTGKSHIVKDLCCQDSHKILKMDNGWYIAAIADGVGSAKNSQIGSQIAAETIVDFCNECMPWDYSIIGIKSMLRTAFNYALKKIIKESEKSGEPIESYDTTLSVVIYDGKRIIYGHSGDGAIIGLTTYGDYVEITHPQKSADMVSVLPLRSGYTQWVIDTYDEDLVAVLLMTDGMLETLCPYLLRKNGKSNAYIPLISFFADPKGFVPDKKEHLKTQKMIEEFLIADKNYKCDKFYNRLLNIYKEHIPENASEVVNNLKKLNYPLVLMQNEQDDKTIVGLINTDEIFDNKPLEFYAEPNWIELQEEWNRKAYPHLYQDSSTTDSDKSAVGAETKECTSEVQESEEYIDKEAKENAESAGIVKITEDMDDQGLQCADDKDIVKSQIDVPRFISNSNTVKNTKATESHGMEQGCSPTKTKHTRAKHERPKKKGFIGKIGDFLSE